MEKKSRNIFFGISIVTSILMFLTFNYLDGQTLMAWSVSTYDLLAQGRLNEFYSDKLVNLRGALHLTGCGTPFMLLPHTIWNFPIWVTHYFNGNYNVGTVLCVYWYKLFLLLMTVLMGYFVYKIILEDTGDKNKGMLGFLLLFSSAEVMLSTMYSGQDEVVYLCFMLIAYYELRKDNKKLFLLWGTFSVTVCPIMLFPFAVLLLLSEKNLLKLIIDVVICLAPNALWEVCSKNFPDKAVVEISNDGTIDEMLNMIKFNMTTGEASVIAILICALFFVVYFSEKNNRNLIWYLTLSMVVICFGMDNFFYRLLMYVPFVIILILTNKNHENDTISLLLLTILEYTRMLAAGYECPQNMNTSFVAQSSVMKKLLELTGSTAIEDYRSTIGKIYENIPALTSFVPILNALTLVCIGVILYINYWKNDKKYMININKNALIGAYVMFMPLELILFYTLLFR